MQCRVFILPSGEVEVYTYIEEAWNPKIETEDEFKDRDTAKKPWLKGLPFIDCPRSDLPKRKSEQADSERRRWRVKLGKVVVDNTVTRLDTKEKKIARATTLDELKEALKPNGK